MRIVVVGAGAIGGTIAGRLYQHGESVILVARGENYRAIAADGLRLDSPGGSIVLPVPVADGVDHCEFDRGDVVLVCVKSQDTSNVIRSMARRVSSTVPVVCAQNGVENERISARCFPSTYAMCVMLPGTHLEPGVVQVFASPVTGVLDIGLWPTGADSTAEDISARLRRASFASQVNADVVTLKWGKLLSNLANGLEVICGPDKVAPEMVDIVRDEARDCLSAHGVDVESAESQAAARFAFVTRGEIEGATRSGSSSWQSIMRSTGDVEADFLNGEITLLGVVHGIPTPANSLVQSLANQVAAGRRAPGSVTLDELLGALDRDASRRDHS